MSRPSRGHQQHSQRTLHLRITSRQQKGMADKTCVATFEAQAHRWIHLLGRRDSTGSHRRT